MTVTVGANDNATATEIQDALNTIDNLTVSVLALGTGMFDVEFSEPAASDVTELVLNNFGNTSGGTVTDNATPHVAPTNEVQQITLTPATQNDTFDITYNDGQGNSPSVTVTVGADDDATATAIQDALNTIDSVTVSVLALGTGMFDVEFSEPAATDVAQLQISTKPIGILSGTPTNSHIGDHNVAITATDGDGETAIQSFTIAVVNTNGTVNFTSTPVTSVVEDTDYSHQATAVVTGTGDNVSLQATIKPDWLDFNPTTGRLTGKPTNDNVGPHSVTLTATDAIHGTVHQSFTITVTNTNDTPTITSAPITLATEDTLYSYTIAATDVDTGDAVTLTETTPAGIPSWWSFDPDTGVLSGTPTNSHVGDHNVVITATDKEGETATQSFTITVANTNDTPTITSSEITEATQNTAYSYTVTTHDDDSGDTLSLDGALIPSWLTFNDSDGVLSGTPTNSDVGDHSVFITATDSSQATFVHHFTITVANINDKPTITSSPIIEAIENTAYSYRVTATERRNRTGTQQLWEHKRRNSHGQCNASCRTDQRGSANHAHLSIPRRHL